LRYLPFIDRFLLGIDWKEWLMGRLTVLALRIVLAGVLAGSLFVQAVMVPLLYMDLDGPDGVKVRLPVVVLTFLGIVMLQVTWCACGAS
jgi:hypothetical protein